MPVPLVMSRHRPSAIAFAGCHRNEITAIPVRNHMFKSVPAPKSGPLHLSSSSDDPESKSTDAIDVSLDPRLYKVRLSRATGIE